MNNVKILIGAQWGDEGKGRWIDILAKDADAIVRFQGGNNAGHTLYVDGQKVVLHLIPSGIFQPEQICALTAGVVINPSVIIQEIDSLTGTVTIDPSRLWVSARSHIITPWHVYLDTENEKQSQNPIGTTKRGIGPTYAAKASRSGLRTGIYTDNHRRQEWLAEMAEISEDFRRHRQENKLEWQAFEEAAVKLKPYVTDTENRLRQLIKQDKKILIEGAQGALLDLDHGTYPYVTSSTTVAGGAFGSLGISPRNLGEVLGVAKAYMTRVGEGPFPTELTDQTGQLLAERGQEFGATTGRPRRCGWLDCVALRYSVDINGLDGIILNKFDILTGMKEIKIATSYTHPDLGTIDQLPWDERVLEECQPEYQTFPGWSAETPKSGKIHDLPEEALTYIRAIEQSIGCPVTYIGTGVNRHDYLTRP